MQRGCDLTGALLEVGVGYASIIVEGVAHLLGYFGGMPWQATFVDVAKVYALGGVNLPRHDDQIILVGDQWSCEQAVSASILLPVVSAFPGNLVGIEG